ncbi:hypothetical protein X975_16555, partial [Stegodyphus mimosarum]
MVVKSSDRLINDKSTEEIYPKFKILLDTFLFLLAAWSEIGYSIFSGSSTSESILDPLKRYLYPSVSADTASKISQTLNILTQVLSYSDAMLTIATISDIKEKKEQFLKETRSGFNQLKYGEIKIIPFVLNLFIFIFSFVVISLCPWIGLRMRDFDMDFSLACGISMFLGQMTIYTLQYGSYIFAAPKRIFYLFEMTRSEKINLLKNIFCTKKGIYVALRTLANTTVMGLRFHGIGLFSSKLILGNNALFGTVYSCLASFSIVYRVLMTQSYNDYRTKFKEETDIELIPTDKIQEEVAPQNTAGKIVAKLLLLLLSILISLTFLLRTFSTPVLCTGPIDNPERDYDIKTTLLASLGLLLGGFAAYQYCKFMWRLGKMASKNISSSAFFRANDFVKSHRMIVNDSNQNGSLKNETTIALSQIQPPVK